MPHFCTHCGHQNVDDARFCESCGSPMAVSMQPAADVAPQPSNADRHNKSQQPSRRWVLYAVGALAILGIGIVAAAFFAPMGPVAGLGSGAKAAGAKEPNAQGNSLFSGLPSLFGGNAGGGAGNSSSGSAGAQSRESSKPSTSTAKKETQSRGAQDIAGLKIGMSPEEVRQVLPQINPKFKIFESRGVNWSTLFISAGVDASSGPAEAIYVQFTETQPRAFFIGRSMSFPKGSRPTKDDLQKQLLAKYGGRHVDGVTGIHQMTASVKPESKPDVYGFRGCHQLPTGDIMYRAPRAQDGTDAPPVYLRNVTVDCDRLVEAVLGQSFGESPLIASGLATSITDFALARSDPKHPANVWAKNNQRMIEEARKNKPKL